MSEPKKIKAKPVKRPPQAVVPPRLRPMATRPMAMAGRTRTKKPAGTITAAAKGADGELMLFGVIGFDPWTGEGVTAQGFNDALESLGDVKHITLRVNSGGGDVFEATAIYNMLLKHGAEITVEIEGVAASAATLISMAGDEIVIAENAHWMIHRASGMAWGNADEMRQYLKLLDNADGLIRLTYSKRTGLSDAKLAKLMDHDNWMTAAEAKDLGFVTNIEDAKSVEPHAKPGGARNAAPQQLLLDTNRLAAMASSIETLSAAVAPVRVAASATGGKPADPPKETKKMNAKLRAKCVAAGMPNDADETAADAWLEANFDKVMTPPLATFVQGESLKPAVTDEDALTAAFKKFNAIEAAERKAFRKEVDANLELAFGPNAPADLKHACYEAQDEGIAAVRTKILEAKKTTPEQTLNIRFADSQPRDRHIAAISTGLQVRALGGSVDAEKHLPTAQRAKGYEAFVHVPLIKTAEQCLLIDGFSYEQVSRLSGPQIAMAAMGFHRNAGIRAEGGLHTTGSLLEVTRDARNKALVAGYDEAPQTWRGPMRQGTSVPDFKEKHVVKLSGVGNLPVWTDGLAPEQQKLSNEKEKYAVEARGATISFSWKLIVNDDMDSLSRRPRLQSNAAGRTVNAVAWGQFTSNPTMADGQALYLETAAGNRKRSNYTTGSATPTNTTIAAMRSKMRQMRGLNTPEGNESEDILSLIPEYIVCGTALEGLILQQTDSGADPASGGNSAVLNLTRRWGLTPVVEPLLDAWLTTGWALFANPNTVDTIEVTFLQGQETPVTHEWMDDATMCLNYTIIQTFAAKAIDHRGIQVHKGAS